MKANNFKPGLLSNPTPAIALGRGEDHKVVAFSPDARRGLFVYAPPLSGASDCFRHVVAGAVVKRHRVSMWSPGGRHADLRGCVAEWDQGPVVPQWVAGSSSFVAVDTRGAEPGVMVGLAGALLESGAAWVVVTDSLIAPGVSEVKLVSSRLLLGPAVGADLALGLRNFSGRPWGSEAGFASGRAVFETMEGTSQYVDVFGMSSAQMRGVVLAGVA